MSLITASISWRSMIAAASSFDSAVTTSRISRKLANSYSLYSWWSSTHRTRRSGLGEPIGSAPCGLFVAPCDPDADALAISLISRRIASCCDFSTSRASLRPITAVSCHSAFAPPTSSALSLGTNGAIKATARSATLVESTCGCCCSKNVWTTSPPTARATTLHTAKRENAPTVCCPVCILSSCSSACSARSSASAGEDVGGCFGSPCPTMGAA